MARPVYGAAAAAFSCSGLLEEVDPHLRLELGGGLQTVVGRSNPYAALGWVAERVPRLISSWIARSALHGAQFGSAQ
jgi:hypothetical protein